MKEFSNPILMEITKENLLEAVKNNEVYCDPNFKDIFHRIALASDDIITRFSCQGHYQFRVIHKETSDISILDKDELTDEYDVIHPIDSRPYVFFLCTPKGKEIIEEMFYYAIELTASLGYPTYIHDLTISHYSEEGCHEYEKTYRMDWKGVHLLSLGIPDCYELFVSIFIKSVEDVLLKSN